MYKDNSQLGIEDFVFPYGKLDVENDWVRLAALVPWEVAVVHKPGCVPQIGRAHV